MAISTTGFGLLPLLYICFGFPRSATIRFTRRRLGLAFWSPLARSSCFGLTHRALGHFWSVSLDVRERHAS